jgi:hypothetical protein
VNLSGLFRPSDDGISVYHLAIALSTTSFCLSTFLRCLSLLRFAFSQGGWSVVQRLLSSRPKMLSHFRTIALTCQPPDSVSRLHLLLTFSAPPSVCLSASLRRIVSIAAGLYFVNTPVSVTETVLVGRIRYSQTLFCFGRLTNILHAHTLCQHYFELFLYYFCKI